MSGLYLHIPYCKSRCIYCDFYTTARRQDEHARYIYALCEEIRLRRSFLSSTPLSTIYLGGGTPSLLSPDLLHQIFDTISRHYAIAPDAEVTLEGNPDDMQPDYIAALRLLPINRISLGLQTFDNADLRLLGRRHTAEQAEQAIHLLHDAGFHNISLDLIYGLPHDTLPKWEDTLRRAFALPISHLSAYALIYEAGTPLMKMKLAGQVQEATDEESLLYFQTLIDTAAAQGFEQYEISNFALPGRHSRHNSSYWQGTPYLGCGAAAHSYDGTHRYANAPDLSAYIKAQGDVQQANLISQEILTDDERYNDFVLTRLRTMAGIDTQELYQLFGTPYHTYFMRQVQRFLRHKTLEQEGSVIRLTRQGIFISDAIMADCMKVS